MKLEISGETYQPVEGVNVPEEIFAFLSTQLKKGEKESLARLIMFGVDESF